MDSFYQNILFSSGLELDPDLQGDAVEDPDRIQEVTLEVHQEVDLVAEEGPKRLGADQGLMNRTELKPLTEASC